MAQDLLAEYARRRRAVDPGFADDLEHVLELKGYAGLGPRRIVLNGIPVMEPPDGAIRMDVGMRHADGSTEVREWTYPDWDRFVAELTRVFEQPRLAQPHAEDPNALRDGRCMVRIWREASLVATLMPVTHHVTPDPMVEEPTTAVESPQAKRASTPPPKPALCEKCGGGKRVCECQAAGRYAFEMHRDGCDAIPRVLCPVCMAGQQDTLPLLGWNYVCDACLGDEETKSIGIIACTAFCQCCGTTPLINTKARAVMPSQLERIRQRCLERARLALEHDGLRRQRTGP
jgi:hypothetical protein